MECLLSKGRGLRVERGRYRNEPVLVKSCRALGSALPRTRRLSPREQKSRAPRRCAPARARAAGPDRDPVPRLVPRPREGQRRGRHHTARQEGKEGRGSLPLSGRVDGPWVRQGARVAARVCGSRGPAGRELSGGGRAAPAPRRPGSGVGRAGRCAAGPHGRGAWRGAATGGWSA